MQKIFFLLIIVFLFISRISFLDTLPATLTHDESVYATQAYSYSVQGTSLDQTQKPWNINPIEFMYAELPATVISLGFLVSDNPLVASHLISAIFGILLPFIIAWLIYGITSNKKMAIFVFVASVLNPLLWQFSRFSVDVIFSLFFYTLGAAIFVNLPSKYKLLSIPIFFIGFFQYQGYKLILGPWILFIILLRFIVSQPDSSVRSLIETLKKSYKKYEFFVLLFAVLLTITYALFLLPSQNESIRLQQTIFTDNEYVVELVNTERAHAIQSPLTSVFINKITVSLDFIVKRYAGTFNPTLMFNTVEPAVSGFTVWNHGIYYWLEGVFIIIGLVVLLSSLKNRLLIGTFIIATALSLNISNVINTGSDWYLLRGFILYVILAVIGGVGLYKIWGLKLLRPAIIVLYAVSVANFGFHYFHTFPINSLDWSNFNERITARYATLHVQQHPDTPLTLFGDEPHYLFYTYLLYGKNIHSTNTDNIAKQTQLNKGKYTKTYKLGNLTITNDCDQIILDGTIVQSVSSAGCDNIAEHIQGKHLSIPQVKDSGERFKIHNDAVCSTSTLHTYITLRSLQQLHVEQQDTAEFCENWITDLSTL